jgi:MoaA/NifB/PqqE/SkfB family radical SAM enzyme
MNHTMPIQASPYCSFKAVPSSKRTYIMKGLSAKKELETYHLILAPSFMCNLRCAHCYLPNHKAATLPQDCVLHLIAEWSKIVVEERGPFGGIFHLKGGEPLILPYLNEVLDLLEEIQTLRVMITTNGIMNGQDIIDRLGQLNSGLNGQVAVVVSLDGSNEAINSQLRGTGSFKKTVAFIRGLIKADVTTYINYVVHRGNLHDIRQLIELALDLNVTQVNFLLFIPKGLGMTLNAECLNPLEVFHKIHAIWENGDERVRRLLAGSLSDIFNIESCGTSTSCECVGGYKGLLYIVPDGTAYSCPNLNFNPLGVGNIFSVPLRELHELCLTRVYDRIRLANAENKNIYRCKGELFPSVTSKKLECDYSPMLPESTGNIDVTGTSYCFNRNW